MAAARHHRVVGDNRWQNKMEQLRMSDQLDHNDIVEAANRQSDPSELEE